jgi:hypothetical protein
MGDGKRAEMARMGVLRSELMIGSGTAPKGWFQNRKGRHDRYFDH